MKNAAGHQGALYGGRGSAVNPTMLPRLISWKSPSKSCRQKGHSTNNGPPCKQRPSALRAGMPGWQTRATCSQRPSTTWSTWRCRWGPGFSGARREDPALPQPRSVHTCACPATRDMTGRRRPSRCCKCPPAASGPPAGWCRDPAGRMTGSRQSCWGNSQVQLLAAGDAALGPARCAERRRSCCALGLCRMTRESALFSTQAARLCLPRHPRPVPRPLQMPWAAATCWAWDRPCWAAQQATQGRSSSAWSPGGCPPPICLRAMETWSQWQLIRRTGHGYPPYRRLQETC